MANINSFTKKYSTTLTLKNELKPVGATIDYIHERCLIVEDEQRSEDYKKAKIIIDAFHQKFIDFVLDNVTNLSWGELQATMISLRKAQKEKWTSKNKIFDDCKRAYDDECKKCRNSIHKLFSDSKRVFSVKEILLGSTNERFNIPDTDIQFSYKDLFGKKLIKTVLPSILHGEDLDVIKKFDSFTSYFRGFNDNRKNVYSPENISTSIPYRIVHDNFPKFLANIRVFNTINELRPDIIQKCQERLHKLWMEGHIKRELELSNIFSVDFFNKFLSQSGIDLYNLVIGGLPADTGIEKIRGLNEDINLATQNDKLLKETLRSSNALKFVPLFKQILSDRDKIFKIEAYQSESELLSDFKEFFNDIYSKDILISLETVFDNLNDNNIQNIYVQGKNIGILSIHCTKNEKWNFLQDVIDAQKTTGEKGCKKKTDIESAISASIFSLGELQKLTLSTDNTEGLIKGIGDAVKNMISSVSVFKNQDYPKGITSKKDKEQIKNQLDAFLKLYNFVRIFDVKDSSLDKDIEFYSNYETIILTLSSIPSLYNKVRNFVTRKPYSIEKFKLNFKNPNLASGWSLSKESDYQTVIFLRENKYYLGILSDKQIPFSENVSSSNINVYRKMNYVLCAGAEKQIPHQCFTKSVKAHFENSDEPFVLSNKKFNGDLVITREIFDIYNDKMYTSAVKRQNGDNRILKKYIDFCIKFLEINKTTSCFDFSSLKTREYSDFVSFTNDVNEIAYMIEFSNYDDEFINKLVSDGRLYLFQIYNKDFAKGTSGKKNLHTLYFESVFDPDNLKNIVFKLNGEAELFYRRSSIKINDATKHSRNSILVNKVDSDGRTIPENVYQKLYNCVNHHDDETLSDEERMYKEKMITKVATHDIVKDRRFTEDKFFFHCPITINFKASKESFYFNERVLDFLRNNSDINIIGVDRGERNLIYVTVVDQQGNIISSRSFNIIENTVQSIGKIHCVNYQQKLQQREKERIDARRSWESITRIATLKDGYMSFVVHEIVKLMVEYNAILVLENLNTGFKRIRQGIAEKSVYQKFEMALVSKLNYLVFKNKNKYEAGGLLNGLQLCNKFTSFKDIGTQNGFVFYVPAQYTSKIDPETGFCDVIKWRAIKNNADKKRLFNSFSAISYVKEEDLFKFTIDLSKLTEAVSLQSTCYKNIWDIYTYGERIIKKIIKNSSNIRDFVEIKNYSPTEEMKKLLRKYNINFLDSNNLKETLINGNFDNRFWDELLDIFRYTLQMRNSVSNEMEDYLLSPVKNSDGVFFDSRKKHPGQPSDADANGAYHIALKGLIILQRNNKTDVNTKVSKTISNKEWFEFVQKEVRFKV